MQVLLTVCGCDLQLLAFMCCAAKRVRAACCLASLWSDELLDVQMQADQHFE